MLISSVEVAARVGVSLDHFRRVWRDWVRDRGFPRPASPNQRKFGWLPDEIDAWLIRQSHPEAMEIGPASSEPTTADRQRRAMREVERITRGRSVAPG